jgi:hypothetical protein
MPMASRTGVKTTITTFFPIKGINLGMVSEFSRTPFMVGTASTNDKSPNSPVKGNHPAAYPYIIVT